MVKLIIDPWLFPIALGDGLLPPAEVDAEKGIISISPAIQRVGPYDRRLWTVYRTPYVALQPTDRL
jgi:hypothetical protein